MRITEKKNLPLGKIDEIIVLINLYLINRLIIGSLCMFIDYTSTINVILMKLNEVSIRFSWFTRNVFFLYSLTCQNYLLFKKFEICKKNEIAC